MSVLVFLVLLNVIVLSAIGVVIHERRWLRSIEREAARCRAELWRIEHEEPSP